MSNIKDTLHAKRKITEKHIQQLQQEGKQGVRYTSMMPYVRSVERCRLVDTSCGGHYFFCKNGFHHVLDYIALIALAAVVFGVGYIFSPYPTARLTTLQIPELSRAASQCQDTPLCTPI